MIVADGDTLNFSVTPNHDMVTTEGKCEAQLVYDASNSTCGATIPLTISGGMVECDVKDNQIVLAAAIVCDGYKQGTHCVGVSRPRKVALLESLGLHKTTYIRPAGDETNAGTRTITTKSDKVIFRYSRTASPLSDEAGYLKVPDILRLSRRQARLLVDSMLSFDGLNAMPFAVRCVECQERLELISAETEE